MAHTPCCAGWYSLRRWSDCTDRSTRTATRRGVEVVLRDGLDPSTRARCDVEISSSWRGPGPRQGSPEWRTGDRHGGTRRRRLCTKARCCERGRHGRGLTRMLAFPELFRPTTSRVLPNTPPADRHRTGVPQRGRRAEPRGAGRLSAARVCRRRSGSERLLVHLPVPAGHAPGRCPSSCRLCAARRAARNLRRARQYCRIQPWRPHGPVERRVRHRRLGHAGQPARAGRGAQRRDGHGVPGGARAVGAAVFRAGANAGSGGVSADVPVLARGLHATMEHAGGCGLCAPRRAQRACDPASHSSNLFYGSHDPGNPAGPQTSAGITGALPCAALSYGAGDGVVLGASAQGLPIRGGKGVPGLIDRAVLPVDLGAVYHTRLLPAGADRIAGAVLDRFFDRVDEAPPGD